MTAAVNVTVSPSAAKTDFLANAREAFGLALPDWIEKLAAEASLTSATSAAKRIGYSVAVVSAVCRGHYKGDLGAVEGRVRGALMGEAVECPVLGEIGRDQCLEEQKKRHLGTSALRTALYHQCRSGDCPHSRLKIEGGAHV